jgi:hypothetical protein
MEDSAVASAIVLLFVAAVLAAGVAGAYGVARHLSGAAAVMAFLIWLAMPVIVLAVLASTFWFDPKLSPQQASYSFAMVVGWGSIAAATPWGAANLIGGLLGQRRRRTNVPGPGRIEVMARPVPPPTASTPLPGWRREFDQLLAVTTAEIEGFAAKQPGYPVWGSLQRQLHAMKEWSSAGDPTPEQRGKINIGLIAARELEPASPGTEDLVDRLHRLSYAWRRWPSGGVFEGSLADLPAPPPASIGGTARRPITVRNWLVALLILLVTLALIAAGTLIAMRLQGASPASKLGTVPVMPDMPDRR